MRADVSVNRVQLLLADSFNRYGNRNETTVAALCSLYSCVVKRPGMFFNQRARSRMKLVRVFSHHLDWELAGKLKQRVVTHCRITQTRG